jgi:HlyD family secretion protein
MKTKTWIILAGIVVCAIVVWLVVQNLSSGVPVEVARATEGPIEKFVDERGMTRLPEMYLITMPTSGRIEAITLKEGSVVERGKPVARIVPLDLKLNVEEATAAVERLDAAIRENAEKNVEETALLQARQFVTSMRETVKAAWERVEAGKAEFDYAEKNLGRVAPLARSGAKTQDELDQAILLKVQSGADFRQDQLVHSAMAALQAATDLMPTMVEQYIFNKSLAEAVLVKQKAEAAAQLRRIQEDQRRGMMNSPVGGVVLNRFVSNERFLAAGTSLLEIGRLEDLEVEADILSLDVVGAKEGSPVLIYGPAIGDPPPRDTDPAGTVRQGVAGTVRRIYPAGFTKISSLGVEQQRVKVIIHIDPADLQWLRAERNLGVGYRVRVRITTARKDKALVIPRSALFRGTGSRWQVFTVRDGRATIQDVKVGLLNDRLAEVTDGLSPGDVVILAPESNLADGRRVEWNEER